MAASAGIGIALFFTVVGMMSLSIGFSTNQWLVVVVNRTQLLRDPTVDKAIANSDLNFFSRTRGLFRECYGDEVQTEMLPMTAVLMDKLSKCMPAGYLNAGSNSTASWNSLYWARIHLLRTAVAAFCLSTVFAVAALGTGAAACWRESWQRRFTLQCKWAGILMFVSAFFNALGMALYHGCDYLEWNSVSDDKASYLFPITWPSPLVNSTARTYGYSYILCWISVFFESASAIVQLIVGWTAAQAPEKDESGTTNVAYDGGSLVPNPSVRLSADRVDGDRSSPVASRRPPSAAEESDSTYIYRIPRAGVPLERRPYYGSAAS